VSFLDDWGAHASRVLENGRALLRVVDPTADTGAGPDTVTVAVSSQHTGDNRSAQLTETGDSTGVFEGEIGLSSGFDSSDVLTQVQQNPFELDQVTATYGSATDAAQVVPSLTRLLDDSGNPVSSFAAGERVFVRVQDVRADRSAGPDTTTVTIAASGGDSETLTLTETGVHTAVFEGSIPSAAASGGSGASGDHVLQTLAGQTLLATHPDANGITSSTDTAPVAATSIRFVGADGHPTRSVLEGSKAILRVVDPAADSFPSFDTVSVQVSAQLTGDVESLTLRETGPSTGVFEGMIRLGIGYQYSGDQTLETGETPAGGLDTISASYGAATATAQTAGSETALLDDAGADATSYGLGTTVHVRVRSAYPNFSAGVDREPVTLRSAATGDVETVQLLETGVETFTFEGSVPLVAGSAVPGDGRLQSAAGDTITASHTDGNGVTSTSDHAPVTASTTWLVDAAGQPVSQVVEREPVRVRVLDLGQAGQTWTDATLTTRGAYDSETLTLTPVAGSPGVFQGQISTSWADWGSGNAVLTEGRNYFAPFQEVVKAMHGDSSASAVTVPALLQILDGDGNETATIPVGGTLRIRLTAPVLDQYPDSIDYAAAFLGSESGDQEFLYLVETGVSTGVFEGSVQVAATSVQPYDGVLAAGPGETVQVEHQLARFAGDTTGLTSAVATVAPCTVELVDAAGQRTSTYLFETPAGIRVVEPTANVSGAADTVDVQVSLRSLNSSRDDLETVTLTETGGDTGVFTGVLPAHASLSSLATWNDGVLQEYPMLPPYAQTQTVRAEREGSSATAELADSVLRLVDGSGADAESFQIGGTMHFRLERPLSNTSSGVDTAQIEVWAYQSGDLEAQVLTETGPDTGVFTGSLPISYGTSYSNYDGTLQGRPGETFEAHESSYFLHSWDRAVLTGLPVAANDDAATTAEDTAVNVPVLANDSGGVGTLTVTGFTQGANGGTVASGPSGTLTYTPPANFSGTDTFTYTASDGSSSDGATVTVTVTPVNDAPVAVPDAATLDEDAAISIPVLLNDSDVDGDTLTVSAVTQGAKGAVNIVDAGREVNYWPSANANGSDSFTYTVSDGHGGTATTTVSITITPVNDPPSASDDAATTAEDTAVTVSVLANDSDLDGDTLTLASVTQGAKGTAAISGNQVSYTPNANANGSDSFSYTVSDGHGGTATASVSVTITPVNDPPTAVADSATTPEDTPVTVSVRANDSDLDGDTLTVSAVTQGTKGSAAISGSGATVTYTPNANANGSDSFTYTVSDGHGGTATANVSITITPVNDPPVAVADSATTPEDTPVTISVRANDSDLDGDTLTVSAVTQGTKGSAAISGGGATVTYTPNANANGSDSFTYIVSDGHGGTASASVSVTITPVNDPPLAVADTAATREANSILIPVLANDSDLEGDALTVTSWSTPPHGGLVHNTDQTMRYTPNVNFNGTDSFNYTVSDGHGGTATATVTVTVRDSLERVSVFATHSIWIQTGADVLSGDVTVNQAGAAPFLDGGVELSLAGTVTTPVDYDVEGDSVTIAAGTTVASDVFSNQLTNAGTITGATNPSLSLPVFSTLPTLQTATPGTTDVNVAANGTRTLAPGSYRDLIVGKRATVTFTGGVYHFRSISVDINSKLYFSGVSEVRVQQKVAIKGSCVVGPSLGSSLLAWDIVFHVAGINGTGGGLAETPKTFAIGTDSFLTANVYAPNGTIWIQDRTRANGAFLGKDVQIGPDVQVELRSAFSGL
jgi:hypothetical protein